MALEISGLCKSYDGRVVLDKVDLDVQPGQICGLLGPNGAGKTTLVSIVSGLRTSDAGSVRVGGVEVGTSRAVRSNVGLAGQETGVYPTVTVLENLKLFAGIAGLKGTIRSERIDEVLEIFELDGLVDRLARNLSGGEKRRLHTAMAMVHRPAVLLLDEPTTGVDVGSRSRLLEAVRRLARNEGCTIVYSTHYLPEIEDLGAEVAILDHGVIRARGSLQELIAGHGAGSVSISFDGPAPSIDGVETVGDTITRVTEGGGAVLAELISQLGDDVGRVRSVDISPANLESVFRTVTGRTYIAEGPALQTSDLVASATITSSAGSDR